MMATAAMMAAAAVERGCGSRSGRHLRLMGNVLMMMVHHAAVVMVVMRFRWETRIMIITWRRALIPTVTIENIHAVQVRIERRKSIVPAEGTALADAKEGNRPEH